MEKTMKMICHERARREEFEMFSTSFKDYEKGATWSPNERAIQRAKILSLTNQSALITIRTLLSRRLYHVPSCRCKFLRASSY